MPEEMKRSLNLKSVANARELGGYVTLDGKKVKSGLLLRTAKLNSLSAEDILRLKTEYNLAHVIDLRNAQEAALLPDPAIDGVNFYNIPVFDDAIMEKFSQESLKNAYSDEPEPILIYKMGLQLGLLSDDLYANVLASEFGRKAFSRFFEVLLASSEDEAVLWHCSGGKDRTGIASVLILSALGVDEKTAMDDYLATNVYRAATISALRNDLTDKGFDNEVIDGLITLFEGVNESFMQKAFDYMNGSYGSVINYIKTELGVSDEDIKSLRSKYLE